MKPRNALTANVDDPDMPVFHCVQDNVHLNRPQSGCGVWHCASRTTVMGDCDGQTILTIEGLGTVDNPHPIQQAFIDQNPGATAAHSRMLRRCRFMRRNYLLRQWRNGSTSRSICWM